MEQLKPEPWMADAACLGVDPELWFPQVGEDNRSAKRICAQNCPVRAACLEYALEHHEAGVWGGTSEMERRRMKRKKAEAA